MIDETDIIELVAKPDTENLPGNSDSKTPESPKKLAVQPTSESPLHFPINWIPSTTNEKGLGELDRKPRGKSLLVKTPDTVLPLKHFNLGEMMGIYEDEQKLDEETIRKEYIAFQLVKAMGIQTPNVRMATMDGKISLEIEQDQKCVDFIPNASSVEKLSEKTKNDLGKLLFVSKWLRFPEFVCGLSIKDNQIVVSNASLWGKAVFTKDNYQKLYGLESLENGEGYRNASAELSNLDPKEIANIIRSGGMPDNKTALLIEEVLKKRKRLIVSPDHGLESVSDPSKINNFDKKWEESPANDTYKLISEEAKNLGDTLTTALNNLDSKDSNNTNENVSKMKPSEIRKLLDKLSVGSQGIVEKSILYAQAKKAIDLIGTQSWIAKKIDHYSYYDSKIKEIHELLFTDLRKLITDRSNELSSNIFRGLTKFDGSLHYDADVNYIRKLEDILPPTENQISDIQNLITLIESDTRLKDCIVREKDDLSLNDAINGLKQRRELFMRVCNDRSYTFVAHLSPPGGIKEALKAGSLKSAQLQVEEGGQVTAGSPLGATEPLPEVTFSISEAVLQYGGKFKHQPINNRAGEITDKVEYEKSVGFVGSYSAVVDNHSFTEIISTTPSSAAMELHVFTPDYDQTKSTGASVPIENLKLVIPDSEKEGWLQYLKSIGKEQDWIDKHIMSYPSWMTINTYLQYFVDPEQLDIGGKPGFLYTDLNHQAKTHGRQFESDHLFSWVHEDIAQEAPPKKVSISA